MKLKAFKEKDKKKIGILLFTIFSVLLITGVILYKTFAIFETNNIFNVVNETIEDEGNIRFMVYVNNELQKSVPDKSSGYSLDTSESHCENGSLVSWNDETWSVEIKGVSTTKTKCFLYFKQIYQESILNGAIPNLGNGRLIPITIDENGKVHKADITSEWYKYESQKWANAVILKDQTKTYKNNEEIPEENIESYFVWIPRYRYLLWNKETDSYTGIKENLGEISDSTQESKLNQQKEIQIVFEDKNKITPSNGSTEGTWLTHPAFTSFDVNGMWVGKFETGYNQNSDLKSEITNTSSWTTLGAEKNENDREKVIIKPNVYSWRSIQIANAFYTSYNYQRELESHMMKNMEWGAVAYLTNSQYGRCSSTDCTESRINNNDNYVTGYSANKEPTCGYTGTSEDCNKSEHISLNQDGQYGYNYYNKASVESSTTGNYYGVFDMSGGAWEYVMGVLQTSNTNANPTSGRSELYNSGFRGFYSDYSLDGQNIKENQNGKLWPSSKYYDLYDFDSSDFAIHSYQRGKLGDTTKECCPRYSVQYDYGDKPTRNLNSYFGDSSGFIYSGGPWFLRGGDFTFGTQTGITALGTYFGNAGTAHTFRIILTP